MTKQKTLKIFCKDLLLESLARYQKIDLENPVKQKQDTKFEFKNNYFNKEVKIIQNDFSEFFSRKDERESLEKIDDFDDVVDMVSTYRNIKKLY